MERLSEASTVLIDTDALIESIRDDSIDMFSTVLIKTDALIESMERDDSIDKLTSLQLELMLPQWTLWLFIHGFWLESTRSESPWTVLCGCSCNRSIS
jgi:hypothetical protein